MHELRLVVNNFRDVHFLLAFEKQSNRERRQGESLRDRQISFILWFIVQMATAAVVGPGHSQDMELHLGLLHGRHAPKEWDNFLLSCQALSKGA